MNQARGRNPYSSVDDPQDQILSIRLAINSDCTSMRHMGNRIRHEVIDGTPEQGAVQVY